VDNIPHWMWAALRAEGMTAPVYNPDLKTVDWDNKRLPVSDAGTDFSVDPVIIDPTKEPGSSRGSAGNSSEVEDRTPGVPGSACCRGEPAVCAARTVVRAESHARISGVDKWQVGLRCKQRHRTERMNQ
jgi:hypothetical protein